MIPKNVCELETPFRSDLQFNELPELPKNSVELSNMAVCTRFSSNIKKYKVPCQAFQNKMDVVLVPSELKDLSDIEQQILARIILF